MSKFSFLTWGVDLIKKYASNYHNEYFERLKQLVPPINENIKKLSSRERNILKGHMRFISNYLPNEVKREVISLVLQKDDFYLIKIEYFTNYHIINSSLTYSKSNSSHYIPSSSSFDEHKSVSLIINYFLLIIFY